MFFFFTIKESSSEANGTTEILQIEKKTGKRMFFDYQKKLEWSEDPKRDTDRKEKKKSKLKRKDNRDTDRKEKKEVFFDYKKCPVKDRDNRDREKKKSDFDYLNI